MKDSIGTTVELDRSDNKFMLRDFAEIIPAVTVLFRLKGFPTARTHSPTRMLSLFPIGIATKPNDCYSSTRCYSKCCRCAAVYFLLSFSVTSIS